MMVVLKMLNSQSMALVICVIMSNIGAKYILSDMCHKHEEIFSNPNMRYVYIFCMSFIASRDPYMSLLASATYSLF